METTGSTPAGIAVFGPLVISALPMPGHPGKSLPLGPKESLKPRQIRIGSMVRLSMTNRCCGPAEGERYDSKYPRDCPASPSSLQPLPYYPNLKRQLRSVTASLVVSYLEIRCPSPQYSSGSLLHEPVTLHLDQISEDLQITRRTLFTSLCIIAARWPNEAARCRALRGQRQFLNVNHTINGRWKLYSVTGATSYLPHTIVQLHRNFPLIAKLLQKGGISSLDEQQIEGLDHFDKLANSYVQAPSWSIASQKESLIDIMLHASVLSGDRRNVRFARVRTAIQGGLLPADALRVRRGPK